VPARPAAALTGGGITRTASVVDERS
jgi:hypothetical protein